MSTQPFSPAADALLRSAERAGIQINREAVLADAHAIMQAHGESELISVCEATMYAKDGGVLAVLEGLAGTVDPTLEEFRSVRRGTPESRALWQRSEDYHLLCRLQKVADSMGSNAP